MKTLVCSRSASRNAGSYSTVSMFSDFRLAGFLSLVDGGDLNILVSILFSRTISAKEIASVFLHGTYYNEQ